MGAQTTGEPNGYQRRRAATRAQLIALGLERMPEKGYSGLTVEDLVRDSRHTRGAFYFHFTGKEDFFLAMLEGSADLRDGWWVPGADPHYTTLRDALAAALGNLARTPAGSPALVVLIAEFAQAVRGRATLEAEVRRLYEQSIVELTRFLDPAAQRGLVRTDRSPDELARMVLATTDGHELHAHLYDYSADGLLDALDRLLRP